MNKKKKKRTIAKNRKKIQGQPCSDSPPLLTWLGRLRWKYFRLLPCSLSFKVVLTVFLSSLSLSSSWTCFPGHLFSFQGGIASVIFSWPSSTIFWYVSDNDPCSHRQFPAKGHLRFLQILWLPHHSWMQWGNIWNFSRVLSKCTIIVSFVNWKKRESPVSLPRWSLGPFSTTLLACPSPS